MTATEFARVRRLDTLGEQPVTLEIEADAGERAALARRFGLAGLDRLAATLTLVRSGDDVTITGRVTADVQQSCVATGEPVAASLDEPLLIRFVPEGDLTGAGEELELGAADCDVVGYAGGAIDLGEAVAETMALALDPFPRAADAGEALKAAGVLSEGEEATGAFAALAALKDRLAKP